MTRTKKQIAATIETPADNVQLLTSTGSFFTACKEHKPLWWHGVGTLADNIVKIWVSYNTIVGLTCEDSEGKKTKYRTITKYSVTTSRHCNKITRSKGLSETDLYQLAKTGVQ